MLTIKKNINYKNNPNMFEKKIKIVKNNTPSHFIYMIRLIRLD